MTEFIGFRVDEAQLDRMGQEYSKRAALIFAREVRDEAKKLCPVDSGDLRDSIRLMNVRGGWLVMADEDYAIYVHDGTGRYAQHGGGRMTPWTFTPDGGATWITTVGQRPQPFLTQALDIVAARWMEVG